MSVINTDSRELRNRCASLAAHYKDIPIMRDTYEEFSRRFEKYEYDQDLFALDDLILSDPFLSLKILEVVAHKKRTTLNQDIDSIKKSLLILGLKQIFDLVLTSNISINNPGLDLTVKRARYATRVAKKFAEHRHDIEPEEVALAALLADMGELVMWCFCPEYPAKVREAMLNNYYSRNQMAQIALCGFKFKDLSICLAKRWDLPEPITELMVNGVTPRARLAKACVDLARHLNEQDGYRAIPDDLKEFKRVLNLSNFDHILKITELEQHMAEDEYMYVKALISQN